MSAYVSKLSLRKQKNLLHEMARNNNCVPSTKLHLAVRSVKMTVSYIITPVNAHMPLKAFCINLSPSLGSSFMPLPSRDTRSHSFISVILCVSIQDFVFLSSRQYADHVISLPWPQKGRASHSVSNSSVKLIMGHSHSFLQRCDEGYYAGGGGNAGW